MTKSDSNSDKTIIEAVGLSRTICSDGETRDIVKPFSYKFQRSRIYGLVGPSGAGKSSLLRLFNRLDEKTGGQLLFHERPIENYSVTELRRKIALVFQVPHMFPGTVADNLSYCCPDLEKAGDKTVKEYLALVGLDSSFANRNPENLSVGQKQRVALVRSLVLQPEILLLDEPTSALDPGAARVIEGLIVQLNKELNLSIILVTHNFQQALRLAEISLVLIDGALVEAGPSRPLFENPSTETTRRFVEGDLR